MSHSCLSMINLGPVNEFIFYYLSSLYHADRFMHFIERTVCNRYCTQYLYIYYGWFFLLLQIIATEAREFCSNASLFYSSFIFLFIYILLSFFLSLSIYQLHTPRPSSYTLSSLHLILLTNQQTNVFRHFRGLNVEMLGIPVLCSLFRWISNRVIYFERRQITNPCTDSEIFSRPTLLQTCPNMKNLAIKWLPESISIVWRDRDKESSGETFVRLRVSCTIISSCRIFLKISSFILSFSSFLSLFI